MEQETFTEIGAMFIITASVLTFIFGLAYLLWYFQI